MSSAPTWLWIVFAVSVVALLVFDLLIFHRDAHAISFREAIVFNVVWVAIGLGFGLVVFAVLGGRPAGEYYAGYLLERALSVDNVFVFAVIFTYFAVPQKLHNGVLFWGLVGALALRAIFIVLGAELIDAYDWVIYFFGVLLIATGIRMAVHDVEDTDPGKNLALRAMRRVVPVTTKYHHTKFFVHDDELGAGERSTERKPFLGVWVATPLAAAIVAVASTDLVFAIDSIPAIFAITTDKFIVYTSNAFALLGMRALYFLLADAMKRFVYLQAGLAVVLVFVGVKFMISEWVHIPVGVSLAFIALAGAASVGISLWATRGEPSFEVLMETADGQIDIPPGDDDEAGA
ncbi:MAG: TerC family protein [Solirubrobacterales bacterium]